MNTYTYNIIQMVITNRTPERPKEVLRVITDVTGTTPNGHSQLLSAAFEVYPEEGNDTFVPFEEITEELARQWVDADLRQWSIVRSQMDAMLADRIKLDELVSVLVPWIPLPEPVIYPETTSQNTTTSVLDPMLSIGISSVPDERIKALIYEVLEEIKGSQV